MFWITVLLLSFVVVVVCYEDLQPALSHKGVFKVENKDFSVVPNYDLKLQRSKSKTLIIKGEGFVPGIERRPSFYPTRRGSPEPIYGPTMDYTYELSFLNSTDIIFTLKEDMMWSNGNISLYFYGEKVAEVTDDEGDPYIVVLGIGYPRDYRFIEPSQLDITFTGRNFRECMLIDPVDIELKQGVDFDLIIKDSENALLRRKRDAWPIGVLRVEIYCNGKLYAYTYLGTIGELDYKKQPKRLSDDASL